MTNFEPEELTAEKNLWHLYEQIRLLKFNRFIFFGTIVVWLLVLAYVVFLPPPPADLYDSVVKLSEIGFVYSSAMLALLLAGFSFFATLGDKDLFVEMAVTHDEETGLSYLKKSFLLFASPIVYSWFYLLVCALSFLASEVRTHLSYNHNSHAIVLVLDDFVLRLFFSFFVWFGAFLMLLLSSFIFNIYHIVMLPIRWEMEKHLNGQGGSSSAVSD